MVKVEGCSLGMPTCDMPILKSAIQRLETLRLTKFV
jgi:hypothetical protein